MRSSPRSHRIAALALAIAAVAAPSTGSAQSVNYAGYTGGCFGVCTPTASTVFANATYGGLTYENASFSGTTIAGFAAIGNAANGVGGMELDNLGAFYRNSDNIRLKLHHPVVDARAAIDAEAFE